MRPKPYYLFKLFILLVLITTSFQSKSVYAALPSSVVRDQVKLNFPDSLTFQVEFEHHVPIESIMLEYGTDELTCGKVIAKAFPEFVPGTSVLSEWTWEMRQSGSLPPGATIWWRWRYSDANKAEFVSETKTVTWLDSDHGWQSLNSGLLNLHWYYGEQAFAQDLLDAALRALERLENDAGLRPANPIHLYIYANTLDMQEAILYEPSWTGGMAYPVHDIVIIGIAPNDIEWGRSIIAHELTHVLVGHLTYSCLGDVPTWLNEGLAVYAEGALNPASAAQLAEAIRSDQLLSVRSLSGGFSEVPSRAYLSYSQSYSLVRFLIEAYGRDKMDALLLALSNGTTIDQSLVQVYGFDVDGMETLWREAVGAPPHPAPAQPAAQPTPTYVPTYIPFAGMALVETPTPYFIPTSSGGEAVIPSNGPPLSLTVALIAAGCVLLLILGVIGLGVFMATKVEKGGNDEISR